MAKTTLPPGTADIFPEEIEDWYKLEKKAREVFRLYGYGELRTPVFEYTEVFQKGIGDETDVVRKEMYSFEDRGGRSLTLRPEGTAGIMRALAGTDVMNGNERRVFYMGPMFRGERPAAGRRRQFHQIGAENVGRIAPALDAECVIMLMQYLEAVSITGAELLLNTRGIASDRAEAGKVLRAYFDPRLNEMCDDCRERIDRNIWRILDCKQQRCRDIVKSAPDFVQSFSRETREYFRTVCDILDQNQITYTIDPQLVRGLDYYVHTVFEVTHPALGAQNSIAGGGRYEVHLPETKKPLIGVGFGAGFERLLMVRDALNVQDSAPEKLPAYLVSLGENALKACMRLAFTLRRNGVPVIAEVEQKSMKAQMRSANRLNAQYAVICGENELARGCFVLKAMESGEQREVTEEELIQILQGKE